MTTRHGSQRDRPLRAVLDRREVGAKVWFRQVSARRSYDRKWPVWEVQSDPFRSLKSSRSGHSSVERSRPPRAIVPVSHLRPSYGWRCGGRAKTQSNQPWE